MVVLISLTAVTLLLLILAFVILRAHQDSSINRWFAACTLSIAGWTFSIGMLHSALAPEFWSRAAFLSSSFIPVCFLAFTTVFPTRSHWPSQRTLHLLFVVASVFAFLSITTPFLVSNAVVSDTEFTRTSGVLYPVFTTYFLASWVTALAVFLSKWPHARGQARV